jgi:hypothetical protein
MIDSPCAIFIRSHSARPFGCIRAMPPDRVLYGIDGHCASCLFEQSGKTRFDEPALIRLVSIVVIALVHSKFTRTAGWPGYRCNARRTFAASSNPKGSLRSSLEMYAKIAMAAASCSSAGRSRNVSIASSSTRVIRWGFNTCWSCGGRHQE